MALAARVYAVVRYNCAWRSVSYIEVTGVKLYFLLDPPVMVTTQMWESIALITVCCLICDFEEMRSCVLFHSTLQVRSDRRSTLCKTVLLVIAKFVALDARKTTFFTSFLRI